ncbi:MAG: presenilin family intramembrane aspartyl protease [Candidatus Bathyarchaeota archaeon]|nr:presenilin family intramembrane aspartyl protease [Candidatus Bathyarchaeota archaeon]
MTQPLPTEEPKNTPADTFKFEAIYLLPILASMLFGLACSLVLLPQSTPVVPVTPIPQDTPGADWGNAFYFVGLIAISATVFYILLKRKSKRIIKGLIVLALTTAAMLLSIVYLTALVAYLPFLADWLIIIPLAVAFTVLFDLAIFRFGSTARNVAVILVGGALGMFFGYNIASLSLWSAVLILIFLAVYDIFAVYKGPVGKIAQSGLDQLQGLSFAFKDIQMGLGDLVFYSMLTGAMIFGFPSSILPVLASVIGIIAGSIITFYMLEKKGLFPGLPFPIFLGLAFGLTAGFLL